MHLGGGEIPLTTKTLGWGLPTGIWISKKTFKSGSEAVEKSFNHSQASCQTGGALIPQRGAGGLPPVEGGLPPQPSQGMILPLRACPRDISAFKSRLLDLSPSQAFRSGFLPHLPSPHWPLRCPATLAERFAKALGCSWVGSEEVDDQRTDQH